MAATVPERAPSARLDVGIADGANGSAASRDRPIGVFDSGVGCMTVLKALAAALPGVSFLYLGDTARLPYGTKSTDSVRRYAAQCASVLVTQGVKALVVACNTAAGAALPVLEERYPQLPVVGVIDPGASAAVAATRNGHIAVVATEGTVRSGAYARAIGRVDAGLRVSSLGCSLFVALAEEGWTTGPIPEAVVRRYLGNLFEQTDAPDTLLLGCTHFPVLTDAFRAVLPPDVRLVDSAATTARAVAELLCERGLERPPSGVGGTFRFLATDGAERFARVGSVFLGRDLGAADVELVDV